MPAKGYASPNDVIEDASQGVHDSIELLQQLYNLTDEEFGRLLNMSRVAFRQRRVGKARFAFSELIALSWVFDLPGVDVLRTPRAELSKLIVERDPELRGPWRKYQRLDARTYGWVATVDELRESLDLTDEEWAARDSNPEPTGSGRVLRLDLELDHAGRADRAA